MLEFQKKTLKCNFALSIYDKNILDSFNNCEFSFFDSLEFNTGLFEDFSKLSHVNPNKIKKIAKIILNMHINEPVIKEIVRQNDNIKENFCTELASQINQFPRQLTNIIINFDLDEAMRNKNYSSNLEKILKSTYYLLNSKRTIIIPLNLPANDNNIFNFTHKFLGKISIPIKVGINLNPHKISKKNNFAEYIQLLRYYLKFVKITYDIASGHKLRTNNLIPILKQLQNQNFDDIIALNITNVHFDNLSNIINETEEIIIQSLAEINSP